jgi:hypothetical protein
VFSRRVQANSQKNKTLARLASDAIDGYCFQLSPRIQMLKGMSHT